MKATSAREMLARTGAEVLDDPQAEKPRRDRSFTSVQKCMNPPLGKTGPVVVTLLDGTAGQTEEDKQ